MTWQEVTDALLQHFEVEWTSLYPSVPIEFPNMKRFSIDSETEGYVRLSFLPSFARNLTVGSRKAIGDGPVRAEGGRVLAIVVTPLESGDGLAMEYTTAIESIWDTAQLNGLTGAIHLLAPDKIASGRDPEIPAWRAGVSQPFRFEHTA